MESATAAPLTFPRHVYVHVPFCRTRCGYCGFHAGPVKAAAIRDWHAKLMRQRLAALTRMRPAGTIASIYWGGGSPTSLPPEMLGATLRDMHTGWPIDAATEITVEANPASLTTGHARILSSLGVTRISLGVQSFDARARQFLQRTGPPLGAQDAVAMLRNHGIRSLGIDLILGIPERSTPWQSDLDAALALNPDHISVYTLTLEPGTPLAHRFAAGAFRPLSDRHLDRLLTVTETILDRAGFRQYEVSNYARDGHACRHNLNTWLGGDYIGFGPSACSRIGRERLRIAPDGSSERETLAAVTDWTERILFMPRTSTGIDLAAFRTAHPDLPPELLRAWASCCANLARHGLMEARDGRWVATRKGRRRADAIAAALLL